MDSKGKKLPDHSSDGDSADAIANNIAVRTLYITSIEADMSDPVKAYFEQFGTVNSVEVQQNNNSDTYFGFVEFKTTQSAATALSNGTHRIHGCDVHVGAAKPWHQPDHILNALDDDCLRAILLKLNQSDLTNAANVCIRFREQAKSVFTAKFKTLNLTDCTYEEAKHSLMPFGSLAQSIDVKSMYNYGCQKNEFEMEILSVIARCTSMLKDLTMTDFQFDGQLSSDLKFDSALSKLEFISLKGCFIQGSVQKLWSVCTELKALHLGWCASDLHFCIPKFEKLEVLQLSDIRDLDSRFVNGVIASNSTIKKLSLIGQLQNDVNVSEIIGTIVENLPNLLEFEFKVELFLHDFACLDRLGDLTSLKVLKLDFNMQSVTGLIAVLATNAIPIEQMQLMNAIFDTATIKNISRMKQLKFLEVCSDDRWTDEMMLGLAKGSQLEKLQLIGSTAEILTTMGLKEMLPYATKLSLLTLKSTKITIDVDDYKAMLGSVQKRPEKIKLFLELNGGGGQVNVPNAIQEENREMFQIDEKEDIVEMGYESYWGFDTDSDSDSDLYYYDS